MMDPRDTLSLEAYADAIDLTTPWEAPEPATDADADPLRRTVLAHLATEPGAGVAGDLPLVERLRAAITVRPPAPLPDDIEVALDRLLQAESRARGIVDVDELDRIEDAFPTTGYRAAHDTSLWRGDITRLQVDAVVNAANAAMRGCFQPFHRCIDNALHWQAGPRMRADCDRIIRLQGHEEPTGAAKATRGYNLPARYVLHTVGPIVSATPTPKQEEQLASCYRSCLELARELQISTLAFCAISTGVFGFPNAPAAEIATQTVADWLDAHPGVLDLVVFDVFTPQDEAVYRALFDRTRKERV